MGRNKYIAMIYFYELPVFSASLMAKLWYMLIVAWLGFFLYGACAWGQPINFTLDFESGDLRGWEKAGNAFNHQPALGDNPTARDRGQPSHHQGKYWIGTYEKYQGRQGQRPGDIQGDRPHGTLTSSSFTIPKGSLSFLVGGGSSFKTRVELIVQDPIEGSIRVLHVSGRNTETMHRVKWDISPYAGKIGKIRIVDESPGGWGHINVDDFRFGEAPSRIEYKVGIRADRDKIVEGHGVKFIAFLSSEDQGVEYQFMFGDGVKSDWLRDKRTVHRYSTPGLYRVFVHVRKGETIIAESEPIEIQVVPQIVYGVTLKADKDNPFPGESVHFLGNLQPERDGAEYWFDFGDGSNSRWMISNETEHAYERLGRYRVIVEAKAGDEQIGTSNPLFIEVKKRPPRPQAWITPFRLKVVQGEIAVFKSASIPKESIKENWTGPGEQKSAAHSFEIHTQQLAPGEYDILLEIQDSHGQRDRTIATLEVLPEKEKQYQLYLEMEPEQVELRQDVSFSATLEPYSENMEYRFVFGDGNVRDWSGNAEAEHLYEEAGSYHAYALVRINGARLLESNAVLVTVIKEQPPGVPNWVWIIPGLFILLAGSYLLSRIKKPAGKGGGVVFSVSPHTDSGVQEMEAETHLEPSLEVRLRPVTDQGKQEIESEKPLLMNDER